MKTLHLIYLRRNINFLASEVISDLKIITYCKIYIYTKKIKINDSTFTFCLKIQPIITGRIMILYIKYCIFHM